jgi:hypothetical protein
VNDPTFNIVDYHRSVQISKMRLMMKYGAKQFKEDWDSAIALAQIMGCDGEGSNVHGIPHRQLLMEQCFERMEAYLGNNPEAKPWE